MRENLYRSVALENGQILEIHDMSRKIGADAWVVIMAARMKIDIKPDLFKQLPLNREGLNQVRDTLGEHVVYEYKLERNMIMDSEKESLFEDLTRTFLSNSGQYVGNPRFPGKLVLKEYRKRIEKAIT